METLHADMTGFNEREIIPIYVGCAPNGEDAESLAVLCLTIAIHTTPPYQIYKLCISNKIPFTSGWDTSAWPTPFSGFRWAVPEISGFQGKSIYTDSDVMFFCDLRELYNQIINPPYIVLAKSKNRLCVSVWDCKAAKKFMIPIDKIKKMNNGHQKMVSRFANIPDLVGHFKGDWNCLDGEPHKFIRDSNVKGLHYTSMQHQPHLKMAMHRLDKIGKKHWYDGPVNNHWKKELVDYFKYFLFEANQNGFSVERFSNDNPETWIEYEKRSLKNIGTPRHKIK